MRSARLEKIDTQPPTPGKAGVAEDRGNIETVVIDLKAADLVKLRNVAAMTKYAIGPVNEITVGSAFEGRDDEQLFGHFLDNVEFRHGILQDQHVLLVT